MHYIKMKRKENDKCNICGNITKLTWDHVPPKASGNNVEVNVNTLYKGLPTDTSFQKKYQSGIKYRSICDKCNNELLSKYDVSHRDFIEDIKQLLKTSISLPEVVHIPVKINKVCRAICGHLLAAKNFYDDQCRVDKDLREYILNEKVTISSKYGLYYWIYPYNTICIVRDIVVKSFSGKIAFPEKMISSISSYPIAFIIEDGTTNKCGLIDLLKFTTDDINEVVNVPINFKSSYYPGFNKVRHFLWPCNIGDEWDDASFALGGDAMQNDSRIGILKR